MAQKKNKNTTDSLFGEPTTIYIPIQLLETLGGTYADTNDSNPKKNFYAISDI